MDHHILGGENVDSRRSTIIMRFCGGIFSGIVLSILFQIFVSTAYASGETRKVRVGIYENHPLTGQNQNGTPHGLFVDIINEIAAENGWEIEFVPDSFGNGIKMLRNNQLDLLAAVARTEIRDRFLDFPEENVCTLWGTVYKQPRAQIQSILDLDGKTIAVMSKGIFGQRFKKLCADFNIRPNFVETASQTDSLNLLKAGKVDAATFNNAFNETYNEPGIRKTSIIYSPVHLTYASRQGANRDLLEAVDSALIEWKQNDRSYYYRALQTWLETVELRRKVIPPWMIYTMQVSLIVILVFFVWIVTLRKQIRQKKAAEQALHDSENRFRSLSDAAFEGIFISDKGKILDANSAAAKMFGYSTAELPGMMLVDLMSPDNREEVQNRICSGYEKPYKISAMKKDGKIFPIEAHARMFTFKGKPARVTAIRDLTEQEKAREEIKTLRGILPICSHCKNIRNDKGYYEQIEAYIHKHSGVDFSHTICPECLKKHYSELFE